METKQTYPYLIVRIIPTVYARQQIVFVKDETEPAAQGVFAMVWPEPHLDEAGQVTPRCRAALVEAVKVAVRETGHRRCVVFAPDHCEYVEADGSVAHSGEPPSAYILAADGGVEFEAVYEAGQARRCEGPSLTQGNLGRTACKVCEALIDGTFGGYCGLCSDRVLADDSHIDDGTDSGGDGVTCALCFEEIEPDDEVVELKHGQHAHRMCEFEFAGWCARCGDPVTYVLMEEGDICDICLEDLSPCPACGELVTEDELVVRPDGTTVCGDCNQPTG